MWLQVSVPASPSYMMLAAPQAEARELIMNLSSFKCICHLTSLMVTSEVQHLPKGSRARENLSVHLEVYRTVKDTFCTRSERMDYSFWGGASSLFGGKLEPSFLMTQE